MSARYSNGLRQARRRARIEAAIQRAIDLLDAMDADPDAEPDADDEDDPAEAWMQPVTMERPLEREAAAVIRLAEQDHADSRCGGVEFAQPMLAGVSVDRHQRRVSGLPLH